MRCRRCALALLVAALGWGCPGGLSLPPDGGGGRPPDVWYIPPDALQVTFDAPAVDAPAVDGAPVVDTLPPDLPQSQPDLPPTGVGGPCPCTPPLLCVAGACRGRCQAPTDGCKVSSNCPATHGCIPTSSGAHVCMPAAGAGSSCGGTVFCAVDLVCASVNKQPYICLPTCSTAGAPCGTGGTCLQAGACRFCSSP